MDNPVDAYALSGGFFKMSQIHDKWVRSLDNWVEMRAGPLCQDRWDLLVEKCGSVSAATDYLRSLLVVDLSNITICSASDQDVEETVEDRFLGCHDCPDQPLLEIWIELWAHPDHWPEPWFAGWYLTTPDMSDLAGLGVPINYCPRCGRDLEAMLKQNA